MTLTRIFSQVAACNGFDSNHHSSYIEQPSSSNSSYAGERVSVQVGCLSEREAVKKRLEPKKTAAARGKSSKRRIQQYLYIEYWFHWKEPNAEGQWRGRSCYLGGHPKGQSPRGKLVSRLDIIASQHQQNRPYGETLQLMGLDGGKRQPK